ncbi:MAG TPA: hypothetical protein VGD24_07680 [Gallionella sp.]
MSETYARCPKCGHQPPQPIPASAACPACGVYMFKWAQTARAPARTEVDDEHEMHGEMEGGLIAALFEPKDRMDAMSFYGRCAALVLLAIWSWFLIGYDYRVGEIGGSFMHNILLPIHEAGHVLFKPFGEFMMMLGGSLFQIALPFAIGIAFIFKNRDNFGASIGVWWASVSLVDLSPYIYDALHPQLTLLGGGTGASDGPHDWIYLLITMGQLDNAQRWGAFAHALGGVLMVAALAWGMIVLLRQRASLGNGVADM